MDYGLGTIHYSISAMDYILWL